MSDDVKQTVADTTDTPTPAPDAGTPGSEDGGAPDDKSLEQLLSEFDTSKAPEASPTPEPDVDAANLLRKEVDELKQTVAGQQFKSDIKPVIETVRGDIPETVMSDDQILDLLDGRARREPALQKAWDNRASNPSAWNKVVEELGRELSAQFTNIPNQQVTEDMDAVTQAVRGSSTQTPGDGKAPDYSSMSDQEYRDSVDKEHGFTPL